MAETDLWFGTLSATVQVGDLPASRQVVAIERQASGDWRVCGQAMSNAEGIAALPVTGLPTSRIYAVAIDDWGESFAPDMSVAYGDVIRPTRFLGWMYQVTSPGVLPSSEPEWWNSMSGIPQPVGTAMMQAVRHYQPIAHGPVSDIEWVEEEYDPHWSNVVALLRFDGSQGSTLIADETGKPWFSERGAALDTARSKFGSSSLRLPGDKSTVQTAPALGVFDPTTDFTVEAWLCPTAYSRMTWVHAHTEGSENSRSGMSLYVLADGRVHLNVGSSAGWNTLITPSFPLAPVVGINTWTHVALAKQGNVWRLFVGGVLALSANINGIPAYANAPFIIGDEPAASDRAWNGWIDEFRFTQGVARYTENFAPPVSKFPSLGPPM